MSSNGTRGGTSSTSWEKLRAPYFDRVCRSILDEPMSRHGFEIEGSSDVTVVYGSGRRFLEVAYYLEDFPRFHVAISITSNDSGYRDGVGLWRFLPDRAAAHRSWNFTDEASLRDLLVRLIDEAVVSVALSLLENPGQLSAALDAQRVEMEDAHTLEVQSEHLAAARRAFDAGRHEEALRLYDRIDRRRLLASDSKRIDLARRRTNG
jgi:hypothetical protein